MSRTTNRTVLDLNKVQHGSFWYTNNEGQISFTKPPSKTVRGIIYEPNVMAAYHPDYPGETMIERATRLNLLDTWTPVCSFQLTANHYIVFTGKKAVSMWSAWNSKIFKKK